MFAKLIAEALSTKAELYNKKGDHIATVDLPHGAKSIDHEGVKYFLVEPATSLGPALFRSNR